MRPPDLVGPGPGSAARPERERETAGPPRPTFYTVADREFFPGLVALLNSLRLAGNDGPVVVLDSGLLPEQRRLLEGHVTLCSPPSQHVGNPLLFKAFPFLLDPAGIVIVIDSDMLVTDALADVVEAAGRGQICLFTDETQDPRWFPEWHEGFELRAPLRHGPSRNSGFVAFSTAHWPELLGRWWEACGRIPAAATRGRGAGWDQPFWDGDQDALNALLLSEIPTAAVSTWSQQVADLLMDVDVVDAATLRCSYHGAPARLLHHTGGPKPWRPEAWMRVQGNAYVQLLPRLLFGPDVELRLPPGEVPPWLRPGQPATVLLRLLTQGNRAARYAVARLSGRPLERAMRLRALLARSHRG